MSMRSGVGALVLALILWGLWTVVLYRAVFHRPAPVQVWDFEPMWEAGRAWLREGLDPYGSAVHRRLMWAAYGRAALPGEDPRAFSYPLYALFLVAPLILLPKPLAQAAWMALLLVALQIGLVLAWVGALPGARKAAGARAGLAALALGSLVLYPVTWALLLGQVAVLVFAFVAAAAWALSRRRGALAGALLALATVKPNLAALPLAVLGVWAWRGRRRGFWAGWLGTWAGLMALSLLAHPTWPRAFLAGLGRYAASRPFYPVLVLVSRRVLPLPWADAVAYGLALGVVGLLLYWAYRSHREGPKTAHRLLAASLVATFWVVPRAHLADQVVLLFPLALWVARGVRRGRWGYRVAGVLVVAALYWVVHGLDLAGLPPTRLEAVQHALLFPIGPTLLALALGQDAADS